jgi:hypothetical protein
MKRFRNIVQDTKAPSTSDLWINNGELKYYTSNGWKAIAGNGSSDVYVLPGNLQTTEGWSTTDVESIVGNWDEFTKAVSGGKIIVGYFQNEGQFVKSTASVIERVTELESKSNVAVLTPTGTKLMELVSSSPNVTQEQLVEAGFTPEICRRLNAGEVIYMSGECADFGNDALYPIQGIAPNSSPDLVPSRLCYCHYSSYNADGTANGGCFTTIKKQSSGQYLVDYIKV